MFVMLEEALNGLSSNISLPEAGLSSDASIRDQKPGDIMSVTTCNEDLSLRDDKIRSSKTDGSAPSSTTGAAVTSVGLSQRLPPWAVRVPYRMSRVSLDPTTRCLVEHGHSGKQADTVPESSQLQQYHRRVLPRDRARIGCESATGTADPIVIQEETGIVASSAFSAGSSSVIGQSTAFAMPKALHASAKVTRAAPAVRAAYSAIANVPSVPIVSCDLQSLEQSTSAPHTESVSPFTPGQLTAAGESSIGKSSGVTDAQWAAALQAKDPLMFTEHRRENTGLFHSSVKLVQKHTVSKNIFSKAS
ncbi:unnamed protein product [Protopolystoma xenopodis]|uniref:Uncharacterized protein n=1 Tax=Protopolystoma xenopodis TaxID=117903 RepID=A0A3S5BHE9_9PLAT|nr:unnamed protein product [Protopolystoma xenopodis]